MEKRIEFQRSRSDRSGEVREDEGMETNHVYHRISVLYEKCYWAVYALFIRRIFSGSLVGLIAHFVGQRIHIQYHQKLDPASQITECSVTASTGNPLYVV